MTRAGIPARVMNRIPAEINFPEELPIAQHRDRIAELIAKHPVTIVCGETGSGKTTQLPKICLSIGRGARKQGGGQGC